MRERQTSDGECKPVIVVRNRFPFFLLFDIPIAIMAFDPSKPAFGTEITSAELRDQFTTLKALIDELQTRLNALPGIGTDAFVMSGGDDATGVVGDPSRPFVTAQAAFNAALALPGDRVLRFGPGYFGGIILGADWPERIRLAGAGATVSFLCGITGTGTPGAPGANETSGSPATPGGDGGNGWSVRVTTDGAIDLGPINLYGGQGGQGGQNLDYTVPPQSGGRGGNGGTLELTGCVMDTVNAPGGPAGAPGIAGAGASGGSVSLLDCTVGAIAVDGAYEASGTGPGGTVTLTRCLFASVSASPGGTFNDTPTAPGSGVSSNVVRG